jgi:hypothetical protein
MNEDDKVYRIEFKGKPYFLPLREIKRHASVSKSNRHRCNQCFTCACLDKLERMNKS